MGFQSQHLSPDKTPSPHPGAARGKRNQVRAVPTEAAAVAHRSRSTTPPGGSRSQAHSPASSLRSTAPRHSRSHRTRWSQTRCAPHRLLTPNPWDEQAQCLPAAATAAAGTLPITHLPKQARYSHHKLLSSRFLNCSKPGSKAAASPLEVCPDMGASLPAAHKPWVLTAQQDPNPAGTGTE